MLFRPQRVMVLAVALCSSMGTLSAGRAYAEPPVDEAQLHFETGTRALSANDPAAALREFETAQSLRPSPVLGYYIAVAYDQMGQACVSLSYYRQYLVEVPTADNRADVERRVGELEPFCQPVPPPLATTQVATAPMTLQAPRLVKKRSRAGKVGVALGVVGAVVTVVVVGAVVVATVGDSSGSSSSHHHHWDFDLRPRSEAAPTTNLALIRF
jgi:hypothetical protein